MQAIWNGTVLADSDDTVVVEGNHYFPREAVAADLVSDSDTTTRCPWKGEARYLDVRVDGEVNRDAAWHYPDPSPAAEAIRGRVAFWHGVEVREG